MLVVTSQGPGRTHRAWVSLPCLGTPAGLAGIYRQPHVVQRLLSGLPTAGRDCAQAWRTWGRLCDPSLHRASSPWRKRKLSPRPALGVIPQAGGVLPSVRLPWTWRSPPNFGTYGSPSAEGLAWRGGLHTQLPTLPGRTMDTEFQRGAGGGGEAKL